MQQDDVEVQFCDLCGTSVPMSDLESGAAVRHQAKTIGACCLAVLRQGESPLVAPGLPEAAGRAPARRGLEGALIPIAIVLAVLLAGATVYLDLRIQGLMDQVTTFETQASEARTADSDVLRAVDQALDGVLRKADLEPVRERVNALGDALDMLRDNQRLQGEKLEQRLELLAKDLTRLDERRIDYRPLFDDLRQKIQEQRAEVAELRTAASAAPAEPAPAPPGPEGGVVAAPGLPADLAGHVERLADADAAVRFEAVDRLLVSKNLLVLPHLIPMTRDADGFVRRLTVEGLRDFRHPDTVEALIAALGDTDEIVADTAWGSLKRLTGEKLPFDARAASKDVRRRQQERWQQWWADNKADFKD